MGLQLPPEARKALEYLGVDWPATDEDVLKAMKQKWDNIADVLEDEVDNMREAVTTLDNANDGDGMNAFRTYAGSSDAVAQVLADAVKGCREMGTVSVAAGDVVLAFKGVAIANLLSLAAAMVAAAAATIGTAGVGGVAAAAALALARKVALDAILTAMTDAALTLLAGDDAGASGGTCDAGSGGGGGGGGGGSW